MPERESSSPVQHTMRELIGRAEIEARIARLGEEITREYAGRELVLMVVLGGAFVFAADLCRAIRLDCRIDFVRVASYGAGSESGGQIRLLQAPAHPVQGKDILLIEDIVDTGQTLQWLLGYFREQGAASARLCAFIDKKERRKVALEPDYAGFVLNEGFLVGYGLDYAEKYRNLPAICTLQDMS